MCSTAAILTENLVKRFRSVQALRGLDITVPQNSIYALVGPNGAGKSTAIKTLVNIVKPTSGRSEILGVNSTMLAGASFKNIGYISENQELPEWMRVAELLAYLRPFYPTWDLQLETDLVRQFNLPLDRKLKNLSRGMRMKAVLASSLSYRPKLIIMDEPFTGLDPLVRDELIQALLSQASEATIFVSSHDLGEVESFASHVGYLENGRLLFSDSMDVLIGRFRQVHVAKLPSAAPDSWPKSWIQVERSEGSVRFVDTQFSEGLTQQKIQTVFGPSAEATFAPMSLRSIFVATARSKESER